MGLSLARKPAPAVRATAPAASPPPFDVELARPIVRTIVRRKLKLFAAFPDLTEADLVQHGLQLMLAVHPKYDRTRGAYSTFVHSRLPNRLIDLWRSRSQQVKRENRHATAAPEAVERHPNERDPAPEPLPADVPLAEFVGRVYRAIVALPMEMGGHAVRRGASSSSSSPAADPPRRRGRRFHFTPAQRMAITVLKRRQNLSTRGTVMLLAERADLRRAIGLTRVPTHKWISQNAKVLPNSPLARICLD